MHRSSERHCAISINFENTNNVRRNYTMRSIIRTLSVAATITILSSTLPAAAAARTQEPRLGDRDASVVIVIKRIVKRFFGIASNDQLTVPTPTSRP